MGDDWDSVTVIRKRAQNSSALKTEGALNAARRTGGAIDSQKKSSTNANAAGIDAGKAAKIDRETEASI
ncbi:multiprotein-bridging factor 1 [Rhizophlyctis rosea]|nr:multiprotein-bridging factor 1 [Rhizophlyctis rosea]